MKKHLFLLAMVASILVACKKEVNPPAIPEHDYSVATKVSKNVRSILGESKADVEKAVLDAGFQIVDQDIFNAPQRVIRLERVPVEDDEEILCFAFNLTPDMVDMTETEIVNIIIDSKTTAILFLAKFKKGILTDIQGKMIIGAEVGNVNSLYLACSDALHTTMTILGKWSGVVTETEYENKETKFSNYTKFYNAVADMDAVKTQETAGCLLNITGTHQYGYAVTWNKPNQAEAREQISKGYKTAIAEAGFALAYREE